MRQRTGILIGTKFVVFVANLFSFAYEYTLLVQLVDANRGDLVDELSSTARYIDDLFSADDDDRLRQYLYFSRTYADGLQGIYTDCLALNCEQERGQRRGRFFFLMCWYLGMRMFGALRHMINVNICRFRALIRKSTHIHRRFFQCDQRTSKLFDFVLQNFLSTKSFSLVPFDKKVKLFLRFSKREVSGTFLV